MDKIIKMSKEDYLDWGNFRNSLVDRVAPEELDMISQFHAVYFNHKYIKPCTCNPKEINRWISQLNVIYDNGHK